MHVKYGEYFSLRPIFPADNPINAFLRGEQDQLFIGVNMQLCGPENQAYIDTLALAERVRDATRPRLRHRFGPDADLLIVRCPVAHRAVGERIQRDSALLLDALADPEAKADASP
jgi:hypothetical protein